MSTAKKTRVVVADDSETLREQLAEVLGSDPTMEVVGTACNGQEAVELTRRLRPDVIVMDISMPVMDGFEATAEIMAEVPTPVIIVSANLDVYEARVSMHALAAGAVGVLAKPAGPAEPDFEIACRQFVSIVKALGQTRVAARPRPTSPRAPGAPAAQTAAARAGAVKVIGIATAAGGPVALHQLLSKLPVYFSAPILVVQRMAPGFVEELVESLNAGSALRVKLAQSGEALVPQTVYFAPDGCHLGVGEGDRILLEEGPPINGMRPSGRFLFESLGRVYGESAAAVVLTALGEEEIEGLRIFQRAGGRILAREVDEAGGAAVRLLPVEADIEQTAVPLSTVPAAQMSTLPAELTEALFQ